MAKKFFLAALLAGIVVPVLAFAQVSLNLNYPTFGPFNPEENQSLGATIGYLYYFIVGIAGLAAFIMLIWGGAQWLVSGAVPSQASEAREKIRNAIIGLLLILASFLIIQVVNPELTVVNLGFLDLGDWAALRGWLFSGELGGRAEYRCQYHEGSYFCKGDLPIVEQGSIGEGEQCIVAIDATKSRGNCPDRCEKAGGENARLGDSSSGFIWHCCNASPGNCNTATETFTFAQTTDRKPVNQSVMRAEFGVYGCDDEGCLKAWRRFVNDTANVCGDPIFDSSLEDDNLCGGLFGGGSQIGSLWIHGNFVAVLYEKVDYGGSKACFDGRSFDSPPGRPIDDLGAYGWKNRARSIQILMAGDPKIGEICPSPIL